MSNNPTLAKTSLDLVCPMGFVHVVAGLESLLICCSSVCKLEKCCVVILSATDS